MGLKTFKLVSYKKVILKKHRALFNAQAAYNVPGRIRLLTPNGMRFNEIRNLILYQ